MDNTNRRKRTSRDHNYHKDKKSKASAVATVATGEVAADFPSSFELSDEELVSWVLPTHEINYPENPEENRQVRVHRSRVGETVSGEISSCQPVIFVQDRDDDAADLLSSNDEMEPFCRTVLIQKRRIIFVPRTIDANDGAAADMQSAEIRPHGLTITFGVAVDDGADVEVRPEVENPIVIDLTSEDDDVIILFDD